MRWELRISTKQFVAIFLVLLTLFSCGKAKEEPVATKAPTLESSIPSGPAAREVESQASSPTLFIQESSGFAESPTASPQSTVIIVGDPGLTISGEGTADAARSSTELEQQLRAFLPQLRKIYDRDLARDLHSMGSLDITMTIEPSGNVSELRFPWKRMSSEKLTSAVYDDMRAWQFSPAEHPVDLRYRMILVPAEIDSRSIARWEQHLAGRMEVGRSEKISSTVTPRSPLGDLIQKHEFGQPEEMSPAVLPAEVTYDNRVPDHSVATATKKVGESAALERQQSSAVSETLENEENPGRELSQPQALQGESENPRRFLAQWYRVTRPTKLYVSPNLSTAIVTRFQPGKQVWVVDIVDDQWLKIRSVKGRRPGFLLREDARPEQRERVRR